MKKSHVKPNLFIKKLYKILNSGTNNEVISWSADEACFVIKDIHCFSESILPQYFKHKNISSFIRQLNMYDFHKVKEGTYEFTHPLFKPGQIESLKEIHRKNTENCVQKETVQDITDRIDKVQSQQALMEGMLDNLEKHYDDIVEQNQVLIQELFQRKKRESIIVEMIAKLSRKQEKESNQDDLSEGWGDFDDFDKI
jgi:vacuolar-type H+-ATPase subunit I/STV1